MINFIFALYLRRINILLIIYLIINFNFLFLLLIIYINNYLYFMIKYGDWGLGIGDWGLGIGDWAQSPIPNPQSPNLIMKYK